MVRKLFYLFIGILLLAACGLHKNQRGDDSGVDTSLVEGPLPDDGKLINDVIQSFSSPVEMAALLKDLKVPYNSKILCRTDNVDDYNTNFKKALGIGVFSVDLGYLNIYNKSSSIMGQITIIKRLADGIQVGQFFDFTTLKRLATSNENLDSLMFLSVNSFNQMDNYLRESNRGNLSALIITGMWIEGLYLATEVYKEKTTPELSERIGEQKIILDDMMVILKNYKNDKNFALLIQELEEIKAVFDEVKITYEAGNPETVEKDGMLIIVQNEKSNVKITPEQIKNITAKIEKIRNKIIEL